MATYWAPDLPDREVMSGGKLCVVFITIVNLFLDRIGQFTGRGAMFGDTMRFFFYRLRQVCPGLQVINNKN